MPDSIKAFDNIDYKILTMLHENCWVSIAEISRRLKINERTAKRRLTRLKETGAIHPTVIVSPDVFGYTTIVDVEIYVLPEKYDAAVEILSSNISVSYLSSGWEDGMNLLIQARFKNSEQMHSFIKEALPQIDGLQIKKYSIVPKIFFNTDKWLPDKNDFKKK